MLVATGRKPNTEGIGLELAGVELTDRGYIKVNERSADDGAGRLGDRRGCGQPAVYAHQRGRFPRGADV